MFGRTIIDGGIIHIPDVLSDPDFGRPDAQKLMGFRAALGVPLVREGRVFGVVNLFRFAVSSFAEKQIELVRTFADQAVIAIENTRLLTVQREALERQTATADVLKVIASSPTDVQPVFEAIAERSNQLLGGHSTSVLRFIDDIVELVAFTPVSAEADAVLQAMFPRPVASYPVFDLLRNGEVVQTPDTETDDHAIDSGRASARARGFRSRLRVPLMGDRATIGVISVTRKEPGQFADQDVALLKAFADQAVIAIQNVKLFDEVQAKTRDLEEALVYQTGSANILKVIASSPTNVQPVLQAIAETACELCEATDGQVLLRAGDELRFSAHHGSIPVAFETKLINRNWVNGRAVIDKTTVHAHDLLSTEGDEFPEGRDMAFRHMGRTVLSVPLLRDNEAIGTIALRRVEVAALHATSRSRCCRPLPTKPSSRSATPACSKRCRRRPES